MNMLMETVSMLSSCQVTAAAVQMQLQSYANAAQMLTKSIGNPQIPVLWHIVIVC
jgi:hypothetical protein